MVNYGIKRFISKNIYNNKFIQNFIVSKLLGYSPMISNILFCISQFEYVNFKHNDTTMTMTVGAKWL